MTSGVLVSDGKGWVLGSVALGWFLSIGVRYIYPPLLPFFRADFEFGLTTAGALLSLLWLAYALGQFPGGLLGDRIGEGKILVISTGIATCMVLVVATSANVWMLFLGTVGFGLATALYGPTRYTIFTDIYPTRAGTAVGVTQAAGSIANTVLPVVAVGIATAVSWRAGYGLLVPAFVGITLALGRWLPPRTSQPRTAPDGDVRATLREIVGSLTRSGIPGMVAIQILLGFIIQGFLGFYPTYLIEIKGFSSAHAATVFGVYFAGGILIQPAAGLSNDRIGSKATLFGLIVLFFVGMTSLLYAETVVHVLILTVLLSNHNGTNLVVNTYIAETLGDDIRGSGLGLLRSVWLLLGAMGPIFVGYFGDHGRFEEAFVALAGLAAVAGTLTLLLPSR